MSAIDPREQFQLRTNPQAGSSLQEGTAQAGPITRVAFSAIQIVFNFVGDRDLMSSRCVSHIWSQQVPKPVLPKGCFGPEQWEQYYGYKVDDVPPVPDSLVASFDKPSPFFEGKTVGETSKLFLVPKGISLSKMGELAQNAQEGHKLIKAYAFMLDQIQERYGDQETEESYWVLMTTDILPDSRGKTREEQLALASREEGYEAPSLLEAAALNFVEYVSSGKCLFGEAPIKYTCCKEEPIEGFKLVVGCFASGGLNVHYYYYYDYHNVGVAGVRRK